MFINPLIASTILSFVAAVPAPIDWKTVSYDVDWKTVSYDVDWKTVSYDFSGVDWNTVSYDFSGIDWNTVDYGNGAPAAAATTTPGATPATSPASSSATATGTASVGPYSFVSIHSGELAVHLQPIYVSDGKLRLGGQAPSSYSPASLNVPTTKVATFNVGQDTLGLNVAVPGGQQLYVNSNGTIGYTVPHSADTPSDAVTKPFAITPGASFSYLTFDGKQQFLACSSGTTDVFDVVVAEKTSRTDCLGVGIAGQVDTTDSAYEWN